MTTKFNSFDASPLGAFVESPLGARNRPPTTAFVVAIAWLAASDEKAPGVGGGYAGTGGTALWDEDAAEWATLRDSLDQTRFVAAVFDAPTSSNDVREDLILPEFRRIPQGITLVNVPRTPSAPGTVEHVLALVPPGRSPTTVAFTVSEVGRFFGLIVIQHIFPFFWDLLKAEFNQRPVQRVLRSFTDQRWLRALTNLVRELVPVEV